MRRGAGVGLVRRDTSAYAVVAVVGVVGGVGGGGGGRRVAE